MTGGFFLSKLDISKNTLTQIPALYELVSGWLILTSVLTGLIVDVVTPVEIFERNQKCLASCDIGLCVKSVKNMKDKEIIDLVNNVWKPLTDYDFPKNNI